MAPWTRAAFELRLPDQGETGLVSTSSHQVTPVLTPAAWASEKAWMPRLIARVAGSRRVVLAAGLSRARGGVGQEAVEVEARRRPTAPLGPDRGWWPWTRHRRPGRSRSVVTAREAVALELADVVAVRTRGKRRPDKAAVAGCLRHAHNRSVQWIRCRAEVAGGAEVRHQSRAVGHPVAVGARRRRRGDDRVLDGHATQRAEELRAAEGEHSAVGGHQEVPGPAGSGIIPMIGLFSVMLPVEP